MDRMEEYGGAVTLDRSSNLSELFSKATLVEIVQDTSMRQADLPEDIRKLANLKDPAAGKKILVGGFSSETISETLQSFFSTIGEVEESVVMMNEGTGKSLCFGFVTFRYVHGAQRALREPNMTIDGLTCYCEPAPVPLKGTVSKGPRRIRVWHVPIGMTKDRLSAMFALFGEIEEGPSEFNELTGKRPEIIAFTEIVYKCAESARRSVLRSTKIIDGQQIHCTLKIAPGEYMRPRRQLEINRSMVPSENPGPAPIPGGIPPPSVGTEEEEDSVSINSKQRPGILRRRLYRARKKLESKLMRSHKPKLMQYHKSYLYESWHEQTLPRERGPRGQFLRTKENQEVTALSEGSPSVAEGQSSEDTLDSGSQPIFDSHTFGSGAQQMMSSIHGLQVDDQLYSQLYSHAQQMVSSIHGLQVDDQLYSQLYSQRVPTLQELHNIVSGVNEGQGQLGVELLQDAGSTFSDGMPTSKQLQNRMLYVEETVDWNVDWIEDLLKD